MCVYIYIYIYIEREREKASEIERKMDRFIPEAQAAAARALL